MDDKDQCNIRCDQIESVSEVVRGKIDMRTFRLVIGMMVSFALAGLGYLNYVSIERHTEVIKVNNSLAKALKGHIGTSENILRQVVHNQMEIGQNQKTVLKKLELDFQELPEYDPVR